MFDNGQGVVIAGKGWRLDAEALLNGGGKLVAQQALVLNTTGACRVDWCSRAQICMSIPTASGWITRTVPCTAWVNCSSAGDVNNQGGTLGSKGNFALAALKLDNSNGGRIIGEQAVQLASAGLDNRNGQIQAVGGDGR